jgi:glutathione peroxidase-family protein
MLFTVLIYESVMSLFHSHKYLVNGQGHAIKSYGHRVQPMAIEADIVALLDENDHLNVQVPQTY